MVTLVNVTFKQTEPCQDSDTSVLVTRVTVSCLLSQFGSDGIQTSDLSSSRVRVMVRVSFSGLGDRWYDLGMHHTINVKNGASGYLAWISA